MRYFLENPPELPLCACLPDGARVAMSERCSWSKSGVLLPFCIHLHFKMYIFLALNVHSVGPVSITVLFLLHIPYLASPDV